MFSLKRRVSDAIHAHHHGNTDVLHEYVCRARRAEAEGRFAGIPFLHFLIDLVDVTQPSKREVHRVAHRLRMKNRRVIRYRPSGQNADQEATAT